MAPPIARAFPIRLGIITPVENRSGCKTAPCHAHQPAKRVLGVLDVTVSLDQIDAAMEESQRDMLFFGVMAVMASSLILWWLNRRLVSRPVAELVEATQRVAAGDRTARVPATAAHELAAVGTLAAGVAHEINNPLTGVLTYASFLLKRADDRPDLKEDLEVIVGETKRCREITHRLLDFARRSPPKRHPTDMNEVVQRSAKIVRNQLALQRVGLELDLATDLPTIELDDNQMEQVLVNLLLNGAHAIGTSEGRVRVTTRWAAAIERLEVAVDDNGCGIPAANLAHIFDPFFTTKGTRGTGLGLAVTWGLVEGHGGSIDVRSEEGKGSCFTVRLPLVTPPAPTDQEAAP